MVFRSEGLHQAVDAQRLFRKRGFNFKVGKYVVNEEFLKAPQSLTILKY